MIAKQRPPVPYATALETEVENLIARHIGAGEDPHGIANSLEICAASVRQVFP